MAQIVPEPIDQEIEVPYAPRKWALQLHSSFKRWSCLVLHRRAGKAQPLSASVLTSRGFVKMGSIREGDFVLTPSGAPTKVVGVYPQGAKSIYRITMADGSTTRATADHLWTVSFANRRRKDQTVTTEYLRWFLDREAKRSRKNRSRPLLDMVSPDLDFGDSMPLPMMPYALGLLLGDGGLSDRSGARFTSDDPELPRYLGTLYRVRPVSKTPGNFHVYGADSAINALGLRGTKSATKFIPEAYLTARKAYRLALIQGLIDTDGSIDGGRIEYCSVSLKLANQTAWLARSLGWYANVRDGGIPQYTYKGQKLDGQRRYRVHIRAPKGAVPSRLPRKMERFTGYRWEESRHAIVSIEPDGFELSQCIQIEDPAGLYVTDDFIVTHNTTAELNHHQRAAMDDDWERARLKYLLPAATESQVAALMKRRIYWHVMPTIKQAKIVAWDILKEIAAPIPGTKTNNSELHVTYPNGNKIYLVGADDPDSLRGPALSGLSLDEYSQISGRVFGEILSKALGDHVGYCIWSGTLKGQDQLYQLYHNSKDDPDWYTVWQDIDKSIATEAGPTVMALKKAMADDIKLVAKGAMTQDEFDQEWYLSTEAAIQGAWYRTEMGAALKEGRICRVPWEPALPVDTDWDIGMVDAAAVVMSQTTRAGEVRIIDYEEAEGEALPYFIQKLKGRPYTFGKHYPPWDAAVKDFGTGKSTIEVAREFGFRFETPDKNPGLLAGIDAARLLIPKCWFAADKASRLVECLRNYRKKFQTQTDSYSSTPVHDQYSHGADAFRGLAVRHKGYREERSASSHIDRSPYAWS